MRHVLVTLLEEEGRGKVRWEDVYVVCMVCIEYS